MVKFLLWCILLVLCWPLALLALVLYPLVWVLTLPFRLVGIAVGGGVRIALGPYYSSGASAQRTSSCLRSARFRYGCFFGGEGGGDRAFRCTFAARNAMLSFSSPCGGGFC